MVAEQYYSLSLTPIDLMKSIMALSMHKAGSTVANYIFMEILKEKGYEIDDISERVMGSPLPEPEVYFQYENKMSLEGTYYGIARSTEAHTMEILKNIRLVIQVRDPRDCITSLYFSYVGSHRLPDDPKKREQFLAERQEVAKTDINSFALWHADEYVYRLETIKNILEGHQDVLLLKYEDMVENTPKWLKEFSDFVAQPITPDLGGRISHLLDFTVPNEDSNQHKRQVIPGDHKRKLSPETISAMNEKLGPILNTFGYNL